MMLPDSMPADSAELWDAIVVGAGPAGGMTALRLAERGYRVLLVEAKRFPRDKVCGGCLNRRAWSLLSSSSLGPEISRAGAIELDRLHLVCGRRSVEWSMPTMRAISRRVLDEVIVAAAIARGATFAAETHARIGEAKPAADFIAVELKHRGGTSTTARAKVVLACDGLTHSSLGEIEQAASRIAPDSRIGLGATLEHAGSNYPAGRLTMVVGGCGYVGVTRVERGRLNIAAALSPESLRTAARPGEIIERMLGDAGLDAPSGCGEAAWLGTPPLTRESGRWSSRRLFLVGDATGYVEPFTGEGMSWALAGAVEVSGFAERAIAGWSDELATQWHAAWRSRVRRHQATCRGLAWLLRRPRLAEITLAGARYAPWLAGWVIHRVAGPQVSQIPLGSEA
jgi:flavin-dependent dehydrogenase